MKKELWHKAEVIKIAELTSDIHQFWFRVKNYSEFNFQPGQFVTFDLPIGEKPADRMRSYSIASAPDSQGTFELVIMSLRGGKASEFFFHAAKAGTIIPFKGPAGKFLLPEKIENDLCFICTGTGIAPFRSMLHHLEKKNQEHKNIFLFFGTRRLNDVLFREEMEALQKTFLPFTYRFVLSKEEDEKYNGARGHVHQLYEAEFANHREADFYLCGWRGMIKEAEQRLKTMNYPSKNIHHEMYD